MVIIILSLVPLPHIVAKAFGQGLRSLYFTLNFIDLKSVDNIFICAIMAANSQVAMLARFVHFYWS